ncbi:MAG: flavin reductase family protein [Rhodocyclaceae bacterium]|nr:flavin reductase family protein [Rhodocyclaceae bacterium]
MSKKSFPLSRVYGLLEPGPVVLITTAGKRWPDIMAQSWHTMLEFEPPLMACGNASGTKTNKFERFGLTPQPAARVGAPLIAECFANLECRVADASMVSKYCLFVLEVIQAWADPAVKIPRTIHHCGRGNFMLAGERIKLKSKAK